MPYLDSKKKHHCNQCKSSSKRKAQNAGVCKTHQKSCKGEGNALTKSGVQKNIVHREFGMYLNEGCEACKAVRNAIEAEA